MIPTKFIFSSEIWSTLWSRKVEKICCFWMEQTKVDFHYIIDGVKRSILRTLTFLYWVGWRSVRSHCCFNTTCFCYVTRLLSCVHFLPCNERGECPIISLKFSFLFTFFPSHRPTSLLTSYIRLQNVTFVRFSL